MSDSDFDEVTGGGSAVYKDYSTPLFIEALHRPLTWRLRLAYRLRRAAYRLDPDASVAQNITIDWEDRSLWVTPAPCEVTGTLMVGKGGSIRSAREYAGSSRRVEQS